MCLENADWMMNKPASLALSDACLTGDQEAAGSIPAESRNILS